MTYLILSKMVMKNKIMKFIKINRKKINKLNKVDPKCLFKIEM